MYGTYLKEFKKDYKNLALKYGEQKIFEDFVKMCAISIYNVFAKNKQMEQEYLTTIKSYDKDTQQIFPRMFGNLIMMFENTTELTDIFSKFYEEEHLGNSHLGQFFTPPHISKFMGEIALCTEKNLDEIIEKKGFITMAEPACGAGRNDNWFC